MTPQLEARYLRGVRAGKAAARRSFASAREAAYDRGYDAGWDEGYDSALYDSGDDLASGTDGDLDYAGGDLDCADVSGPVYVGADDPHGLDADGDGVGCE